MCVRVYVGAGSCVCTRTQIHNYELRWNIERDGGAGVGAGGGEGG